jgi:NADH-quinone oxidoreductase subunit L
MFSLESIGKKLRIIGTLAVALSFASVYFFQINQTHQAIQIQLFD